MQDEQPNGEAVRLFNSPLLTELLDDLEREAFELIVSTHNEEERVQRVWEVRAIRNLREKLSAKAKGKTNLSKQKAVA